MCIFLYYYDVYTFISLLRDFNLKVNSLFLMFKPVCTSGPPKVVQVSCFSTNLQNICPFTMTNEKLFQIAVIISEPLHRPKLATHSLTRFVSPTKSSAIYFDRRPMSSFKVVDPNVS